MTTARFKRHRTSLAAGTFKALCLFKSGQRIDLRVNNRVRLVRGLSVLSEHETKMAAAGCEEGAK